MATEDRKKKAAAQTGLYLVVLAAIAVVVNLIAFSWNERFDWTKNERYTLSKGSARLVENLKSPIQVDAYVTTGLAQLDSFTRDLTEITASVLAWFAVGLPAFVLIKIFQPAYYAREDMKTPMWFSGANAIVNVTLALLLFPVYGVAGLAIATSAAGWLNVVLLGGALWRQGLLQLDAATIRNSGIIVAASLLVGLVLWAGQGMFSEMLLHDALGIRIFSVLALILVAMLVYFAITIVTGAIPGQQLLRLLRRPRKNSAT